MITPEELEDEEEYEGIFLAVWTSLQIVHSLNAHLTNQLSHAYFQRWCD